MTILPKPLFEPLGDDTYKIKYPEQARAGLNLARKIESGEAGGEEAARGLEKALSAYPYNFTAAFVLSDLLAESGQVVKFCEVRYEACKSIFDILPEDGEIPTLNWESKDNQPLLFLLQASAADHFVISDYELSAAMLETALELDPEDHLNVSKMLAYCYVALDEPESYEEVIDDIDDKDPEKALVKLWASFRFKGTLDPILLKEVKGYKPLYSEFISPVHIISTEYLADIDSDRPSAEARARRVWFQTESLWNNSFADFIKALRDQAGLPLA